MAGDPRHNLRRLGRAVAAVERRRVYRGESSRPRWSEPPSQVKTGVVSGSITARSGTTLGVGQVTLCVTDVTAGTEVVSGDPGDVVTVFNSYATPFAADASKRCKLHREGGCWKFLTREC